MSARLCGHGGDAAAVVAPADVNVSIEWLDDEHSRLRASASLDFAREYEEADMSMAIAIAAYNMKNDAWAQANYFSGDTTLEGPLWDIFTKGGKRISGLTFNDVAVSNGAGVDDVYSVGEVVATEYYDLQGRRLSKPVPGQLVVKAARLSDGSTRQEKVIM